jgi:ribose transport system permease protein
MDTPESAQTAQPLLVSVRRRLAAARPDNLIVYLGFLAVIAFFAVVLQDRGFLTADNFANIARQTAMVSIMAFGMTFVLSAGEIDLSIGSIVALCAMVVAILLRETTLVVAVAGALAAGLAIGLVNGLLTTKLRIPSFLVTLGMLSVVVGLARITTNLEPVPVTDRTFAFLFGSGSIGPVPILLVWTALFLVIFHVVYRHTPFGRKVLATGGNRVAARYSGIDTDRIKIATLLISAGTAAVAGMLYAGRLQGARYTLGEADLLTVIAATVIGGTSMFGGKGSIIGALVGSLLMGVLNNGLLLMGLSVSEQLVARGVIIIIAVALSLREART